MADVSSLVSAVQEKKAESEIGKKLNNALKEANKPEIKTPEEYIREGYEEALGSGATTPTRASRAKTPGARKKITKEADAATRAAAEKAASNLNKTGWTPEEVGAVALMRKKCFRWFDKFPHRLVHYFPQRPPIESMGLKELQDLDTTVKVCLDEGDECEYARRLFVLGAGVIENGGPAFYKRFAKWIPGAEILCQQEGLKQAVEHLSRVPGDEGLADEVNRVGIEWTGYAPSNPWMNGAAKIYSIMSAVAIARNTQSQPSDPIPFGSSGHTPTQQSESHPAFHEGL